MGYSDEPSCVGICPVDAIVPDPNNAETQEELQYKYESLQEEI
ncbi:Ferredoxin [Helicobacter heilmannii]|uniref:Ferredoxin n=1 Tax=Helicobacter heilmannii TaxID=35817 RepID=A0A0K2XKV9_HELHE|nr:Ferredoxin [Helicobacter heilmannii ASB1.4]CRF45409.1 Ferredoxin [Helicobacter heilmannii]CRF49077.1 Ferredoxin [Helicobacter heilmannii]CRI34850.1 Ferredoxin [Helicobacter heilmannii]